MKRPSGVTLTAVVQVLGSLVVLLSLVDVLYLPAAMHSTPSPPPLVIYAVSAVLFPSLGLLTAVGLFRLKKWARYSTLIFAALLALFALVAALGVAVIQVPIPPAEAKAISPQASTLTEVKTVVIAIYLGFIGLCAVWLYYFTRAATKAAFAVLIEPDLFLLQTAMERRAPVHDAEPHERIEEAG